MTHDDIMNHGDIRISVNNYAKQLFGGKKKFVK